MIYFHFTPGSPQSPNTDGEFGKEEAPYLQHEEGEVSGNGRRRKKRESTVSAWLITTSHCSLRLL